MTVSRRGAGHQDMAVIYALRRVRGTQPKVEDVDADLGRFTTYPKAVQFFLCTYINDQLLDDEIESMDHIIQGNCENALEFYRTLMKSSCALSGAFLEQELLKKFEHGLHPNIRSLLRTVRREFIGPNSLVDFAKQAAAIGEWHHAVSSRLKTETLARLLAAEWDIVVTSLQKPLTPRYIRPYLPPQNSILFS